MLHLGAAGDISFDEVDIRPMTAGNCAALPVIDVGDSGSAAGRNHHVDCCGAQSGGAACHKNGTAFKQHRLSETSS
jgi:hypothetical protein